MNFLDQVYFDNTLRAYIAVGLAILLALFLKRVISKYATALLFKLGKTQWSGMEKRAFDNLIIRPLEKIFLAIIVIFTLDRLTFPGVLIFSIHKVTSRDIVDALASAILIICVVSLILRFMDFLVQVIKYKSRGDKSLSEYQLLFFFKDFIRVVIIIFGIIFILKFSLHLDIGNLLTGLSIVGAALALSARESLENLIASFVIFFDKPFRTGDVVHVKDVKGTVERIGLRSTRIRTVEKSLVTVPNKQMVDSILDNWSSRDLIRNEISSRLSPDTSSDKLEYVVNGVKEIFSKQASVQSYTVFLQEISRESATVLSVYFTALTLPADEANSLKQEIHINIRKLMEQLDIQPSNSSVVNLVNRDESH
jgi:MscS family membrane protein